LKFGVLVHCKVTLRGEYCLSVLII
jgi:hypothetical protein